MRILGPIIAVVCVVSISARSQEPAGSDSRPESRRVPFVLRTGGNPELLARLERGECFGSCPSYKLEICDDGKVKFSGISSVAVTGSAESVLSVDQCDRLVQAFVDARFFDLEDNYVTQDVTDHPEATITFRFKGREKRIHHYHGDLFAPASLGVLERAVDKIVGSDVWVFTPKQKKDLEARNKFERERAARGQGRPTVFDLLGTWKAYSERFAIGAIADPKDVTTAATIRFHAEKRAPIGARLLVLHDRHYLARIRIVGIDGTSASAVVEHCEPGAAVARGDVVWNRPP